MQAPDGINRKIGKSTKEEKSRIYMFGLQQSWFRQVQSHVAHSFALFLSFWFAMKILYHFYDTNIFPAQETTHMREISTPTGCFV